MAADIYKLMCGRGQSLLLLVKMPRQQSLLDFLKVPSTCPEKTSCEETSRLEKRGLQHSPDQHEDPSSRCHSPSLQPQEKSPRQPQEKTPRRPRKKTLTTHRSRSQKKTPQRPQEKTATVTRTPSAAPGKKRPTSGPSSPQKAKRVKCRDKFQEVCLQRWPWLNFDGDELGMFCGTCKVLYPSDDSVFIARGCRDYKTSALIRHASCR